MATILTAATEGELRDAIFQVSNDFANGVDNGPYTINITAEFLTLTQSLPMIRGAVPGDGSAQITINGNGFIDANFPAACSSSRAARSRSTTWSSSTPARRAATAAMAPAVAAAAAAGSAPARPYSSTTARW